MLEDFNWVSVVRSSGYFCSCKNTSQHSMAEVRVAKFSASVKKGIENKYDLCPIQHMRFTLSCDLTFTSIVAFKPNILSSCKNYFPFHHVRHLSVA